MSLNPELLASEESLSLEEQHRSILSSRKSRSVADRTIQESEISLLAQRPRMKLKKDEQLEMKLEGLKGSKMPFMAEFLLTPIQKYILYGKFPWKMLSHICLVILASMQIMRFNELFHT